MGNIIAIVLAVAVVLTGALVGGRVYDVRLAEAASIALEAKQQADAIENARITTRFKASLKD